MLMAFKVGWENNKFREDLAINPEFIWTCLLAQDHGKDKNCLVEYQKTYRAKSDD